jgi:hypothetical protein
MVRRMLGWMREPRGRGMARARRSMPSSGGGGLADAVSNRGTKTTESSAFGFFQNKSFTAKNVFRGRAYNRNLPGQ